MEHRRALGGHTQDMVRVQDIMRACDIITCSPTCSVDTALELLVEHRITELPVVDANNTVVGLVSDFDLLALEALSASIDSELFPDTDQTWQTFAEVNKLLARGTGKLVSDVMTTDPITVRASTNINAATRILLHKKMRRLPVVDEQGRLLGLISRRDIVRVCLAARQPSSAGKPTAA
ncbi:hypothetical protein FOA52_007190 [Chlamydomonas sp. UWO 241]|nr:hypothetical protein FOA52_007190 [Chlamydomonas sp. UWO 241]